MNVKIDADEWRASNQKLAALQVENKRLGAKNKELQQGIINDRDDVVLVPKRIYDQFEKFKAENKRLREALSFDECILKYAKRMQYKLDKNKHKECATMNPDGTGRGWSHCMVVWLIGRLQEETKELNEALGKRTANPEAALDEAADVGNFAMMIFDNVLAEQALKGPQ